MMPWLRKIVRVQWGEGHPTWNAVWITLGPLWLIWCAPDRSSGEEHPDIPGHPSVWMLAWRRGTPEWDPAKGKWKALPDTGEPTEPEWDAENPHDVAAQLPPLEKIMRDLEYRLPGSGKPLANIGAASRLPTWSSYWLPANDYPGPNTPQD
jgi:hypothetical protein